MKAENGGSGSRNWTMLLLAFLISFVLHLLLFGTAPMVDEIVGEMGLTYAKFGFIYSIVMITLIVLRIPWGVFIDKHGYLTILKVSMPLISLAAVVRGLSPNYPVLLSSQILLGVGLASILPCLPPLVGEWSSSSTGFGTGIYVSGFALGNGTALGLTPLLLPVLEWRTILLVYGVLAWAVTALWWVFAESGRRTGVDYDVGGLVDLLGNGYVWVLAFFMIACMGGYDTLATWMPKVLETKSLQSAAAFLLPLGFLVSGPIVGTMSDRFERGRNFVALLGGLAGLSVLGIIFAEGLLLLPLIFSAGFFFTGLLTLTLEAPAKHGTLSPSAGSVSALVSSIGNVGPGLMPVLFGHFIDLTGGFHASLLMVGLVTLSIFLTGSRYWRRSD